MGKRRTRTTKHQNDKSASGVFRLILGDIGYRPAYAIAYNNSRNEFESITAAGWICESCGEIHSTTGELGLDLTVNEFAVLMDNVKHIDDDLLKEEDAMNEAAVEAAFDFAKRLYQALYTDDATTMVQ